MPCRVAYTAGKAASRTRNPKGRTQAPPLRQSAYSIVFSFVIRDPIVAAVLLHEELGRQRRLDLYPLGGILREVEAFARGRGRALVGRRVEVSEAPQLLCELDHTG